MEVHKFSAGTENQERERKEKEKGEMQVDESAGCSGVSSSNFWNNSRSRTGTISTNTPKYFMFSASVSIKYTFNQFTAITCWGKNN